MMTKKSTQAMPRSSDAKFTSNLFGRATSYRIGSMQGVPKNRREDRLMRAPRVCAQAVIAAA